MSAADIELRPEERTPCEVWTRVMGYHRPVAAFNPGKRAEHAERRHYRESPLRRASHKMPAQGSKRAA